MDPCLMLPFEYRVVLSEQDSDEISLINKTFCNSYEIDKFEISSKYIGRKEMNFYESSKDVGFTFFKSKTDFVIQIFSLDIDGNAEGIFETFTVNSNQKFIFKNHPLARFKFIANGKISRTLLRIKDESFLACFDYGEELIKFIQSSHLDTDCLKKYSESFYEKSYLTLENFLLNQPEFNECNSWPRAGPADYRNFKYNMADDWIKTLMKSKEFMSWLSSLTGLPIIHPAVPIYTRCLQTAGEYQILHGNYSEPYGLDLIYSYYQPYGINSEWPESACGRIHYLNNDGDEIFEVKPVNNSLTIVYRTEGCSRFTENVKGSPSSTLFQSIAIYTVAEESSEN